MSSAEWAEVKNFYDDQREPGKPARDWSDLTPFAHKIWRLKYRSTAAPSRPGYSTLDQRARKVRKIVMREIVGTRRVVSVDWGPLSEDVKRHWRQQWNTVVTLAPHTEAVFSAPYTRDRLVFGGPCEDAIGSSVHAYAESKASDPGWNEATQRPIDCEEPSWSSHSFTGLTAEPVSAENPDSDYDTVNRPMHYIAASFRCPAEGCDHLIEPIDVIEGMNLPHHEASAFAYLARARFKSNHAEDLEKAAWYLSRAAAWVRTRQANLDKMVVDVETMAEGDSW